MARKRRRAYTHKHIHMLPHINRLSNKHAYACAHTHTHIHMLPHINRLSNTHAYACTHTHTHIYTHTYTCCPI